MDLREFPILYVDDDNANRIVMKHNLAGEFALHIADSAQRALEILAEQRIAVLLTDQRMPGLSGVDLAEQVLHQYPEVIRVIITAYSDLEATIDAINRAQVNRFIKKPWTREELVAVMTESITSYRNAHLVKELQGRLIELDRMTSLAIMASAVAHDLRQPLAYIEPTIEVLQGDLKHLGGLNLIPPAAVQRVQNMTEAVDDLAHGVNQLKVITQSLLKSLRSRESELELIDLTQAMESAVAITRGTIITRARFDVDLPDGELTVMGQEGRILQLVVNLLLNAVQAIEPGATMTNRVGLKLRAGDEQAFIEVSDTGQGIPEELMEQIFAPFFTTKQGTGTGLGLPICRQIVEEMRGSIQIHSEVGKGTTFRIDFPRQRE